MSDEKTVIWQTKNASGWTLEAFLGAGTLLFLGVRAAAYSYSWTLVATQARALVSALLTWALSVEPEQVDAATEDRWGRELKMCATGIARLDDWIGSEPHARASWIDKAKRLRAQWNADRVLVSILEQQLEYARTEVAVAKAQAKASMEAHDIARRQRDDAKEELNAARNKAGALVDEFAGCCVLLREQTEEVALARSQRDRAASELGAQKALTLQERARAARAERDAPGRVRALAEEAEGKLVEYAKDRAAMRDEVKRFGTHLIETTQKLAEEEERRRRDGKDGAFLINSLKNQLDDTESTLDATLKELKQVKAELVAVRDAAFLIAAQPSIVLALVAEVRRLRQENQGLRTDERDL